MTGTAWALQQAIFAELCASDAVETALGAPPRLYDSVPRDAEFPFAVLGEADITDASTATERACEHRIQITLWSRHRGHREIKEAAGVIRNALDGADLPIPGLVYLRFVSTNFEREHDGLTLRGSLLFRALIEE